MIARALGAELRSEPFPHTTSRSVLEPELCHEALLWMETDAPWKLRVASFYEQWEVRLDASILPPSLRQLIAPAVVRRVAEQMLGDLASPPPALLEATAHKLTPGQTIRIHNDYRSRGETHRLLVQLNRGWEDDQGGLLMLFSSGAADDVARVIRPLHGSAVGFAISPVSFHAVSTVRSGCRYTLVYSFRAPALDE